ncbi:hypothetical protein C0J52_11387 [Blattella germanica]|nr:hypothetical protein C0J52_11387 [Blattella germanica]
MDKIFQRWEYKYLRRASCSHSSSASTDPNKERVNMAIRDNRHITVHEIAMKLAIKHRTVQEMIHRLSYRKVFAD